MGALVGINGIPKDMLDTLLSYDCLNDGHRRPEFLSVMRHVVPSIEKLI